MLPLMYILEINDIMFCVKSLKFPQVHFKILDFVSFAPSGSRSGSRNKMQHIRSNNYKSSNFYFNRLPRLWNALPYIDLSSSISSIKCKLHLFLTDHFYQNFSPHDSCSLHFMCPCASYSLIPLFLNCMLRLLMFQADLQVHQSILMIIFVCFTSFHSMYCKVFKKNYQQYGKKKGFNVM